MANKAQLGGLNVVFFLERLLSKKELGKVPGRAAGNCQVLGSRGLGARTGLQLQPFRVPGRPARKTHKNSNDKWKRKRKTKSLYPDNYCKESARACHLQNSPALSPDPRISRSQYPHSPCTLHHPLIRIMASAAKLLLYLPCKLYIECTSLAAPSTLTWRVSPPRC